VLAGRVPLRGATLAYQSGYEVSRLNGDPPRRLSAPFPPCRTGSPYGQGQFALGVPVNEHHLQLRDAFLEGKTPGVLNVVKVERAGRIGNPAI